MTTRPRHLLLRGAAWSLTAAALLHALIQVWRNRAVLAAEAPLLAAVLACAAVLAYLASERFGRPVVRLTQALLLSALVIASPPAGLVVALAAVAAGRGSGIAGLRRGGASAAAAVLAAVAAADGALALTARAALPFDVAGLAGLIVLFGIVQGLAVLIGGLLDPASRPATSDLRALLLESVNVPLAWILVGLIQIGASARAAAFVVVLLLAQVALLELSRAVEQSRRSAESLASRVTELNTLHAIGREILSSLEPDRVARVVERECRKILDVDVFTIVLADADGSGLSDVYCRRRGDSFERRQRSSHDGLSAWVVEEKRGLRVEDLPADPRTSRLRSELLEPHCRSMLAVPLVVEDRVTGMLLVQSARKSAYDEHQLSLLTTVAQQAAVALENARHYEMATVDSLTGFFLRDYFFRRLDEEFQRVARYGGSFSVLMIDLDDFKEINDRHGHLAGDHYLGSISRTILKQLRGADLGCRYGGDEFCLLLPETDVAGSRVIAERIRQAVSAEIVGLDDLALRTTVSIGVAAYPEHHAGNINSLLRNADEALYRAKRAGRDCVVPFAA